MAVNSLRHILVDGLRRLQFAVLPPHCLLCGQAGAIGRDLCAACAADILRNRVCCPRCALPLDAPAPLCGECLQSAPSFASACVPFVYANPLDQLETRFKFGRNLAAGRVLSELWIDAARENPPPLPQALVPVPLHPERLRERGYNQALELARPISREFGIALYNDILVRERSTAAQSHLDADARHKNLQGAFALVPNASLPAHIALFDDVMTTGTTLRECARTLVRAGAQRVDVWAVARAPKRYFKA
ncbi:MAG: ComF family protein [Xanthomonadales bacterium PRO7]|jgi:ComF family protein|nr:ComF family protein [Xanthomonadales bacterium PRO7]HMM58053.1 ComF family protein [Rudaea sp.]